MFSEDPDLVVERHRLHVVEQWPDGPRKQASLAAARARLDSLTRAHSEGVCGDNAADDEKPTAPGPANP